MTHLGLDLGTAYAKLARCPGGEQRDPSGIPGVTIVQSAVTYRDDIAEIPSGYRTGPPGALRCDGFAPLLGTALADAPVTGWQDRTPAQVAQDFLGFLLPSAGADHAMTRADGKTQVDGETRLGRDDRESGPSGMVLAVPPPPGSDGQRAEPATGTEDVLSTLGWRPDRLVNAPVAALLWFRHHDPRLGAASRFLVVDAGAGSVEFSLCASTGTTLRVADSARLSADAAWEGASRARGTDGTRSFTLTEHLVAALAAETRGGLAHGESARLGRAFEAVFAKDAVQDRLDAVLQQAAVLRQRHGSTVAVRLDGLEVTASQFLDATEPLARQCAAALGELLGRQHDPGWRRYGGAEGTRVVLLGGLTALWPLRAGLLSFLGFDPERPGDGALIPASDDRMAAVARGAALVAAGLADPGDRYPYGLRLLVHRAVRDQLVTEHLTLAAPGSIVMDQVHTGYLMQADGTRRVVINVPAGPEHPAGDAEDAPIAVEVVPRDAAQATVTCQPAAPPGAYWIGVRGGPDGLAVLLSPVDGGRQLTYPLAQLTDTGQEAAR
jgi:hypothetical protein